MPSAHIAVDSPSAAVAGTRPSRWRLLCLLVSAAGLYLLAGAHYSIYYHHSYWGLYGYHQFLIDSGPSFLSLTQPSLAGYRAMPNGILGLMLLMGALLTAGGWFWYRKRFSLRQMMLALVAGGVISMAPFVLPEKPVFKAWIDIQWPPNAPKTISAADLRTLCRFLESEEALVMMPSDMRNQMGFADRKLVNSVECHEESSAAWPYSRLSITFDDTLSDEQTATLFCYLSDLLLWKLSQTHFNAVDPLRPDHLRGSRWGEWQDDWHAARDGKSPARGVRPPMLVGSQEP